MSFDRGLSVTVDRDRVSARPRNTGDAVMTSEGLLTCRCYLDLIVPAF
jgi:hypothetical protein